jgi:hypothetical protein
MQDDMTVEDTVTVTDALSDVLAHVPAGTSEESTTSHTTSTRSHLPASSCSHVWIDPDEAPIARAPYSPVIGPRRREMKDGHAYRCQGVVRGWSRASKPLTHRHRRRSRSAATIRHVLAGRKENGNARGYDDR